MTDIDADPERLLKEVQINSRTRAKAKTYVAKIESDPDTGDQVLVFPDDFLKDEGWLVNDVIRWDVNPHGFATLTNLTKVQRTALHSTAQADVDALARPADSS